MAKVGYTVEDGRVFYTHHYVGKQFLDGADAATFSALSDPIVTGTDNHDWHFAGKDRASVWFMHTRIDDADAASFRYFHGGQCKWGADSSHLFCLYVDAQPRVKVVKSKAVDSFRFLDEPFGAYMRQYALDDRRVYFYGRWVRGADPQSFRNIAKDRFDEPPAPSDVYRDDRFAYHKGRRVDGIDPDTLIVLHHPSLMSRTYAIDRDAAYRVDNGLQRITDNELQTKPHFQQLRDYLARRSDLTDYWFNRDAL